MQIASARSSETARIGAARVVSECCLGPVSTNRTAMESFTSRSCAHSYHWPAYAWVETRYAADMPEASIPSARDSATPRERVLVSACLVGRECRFDGRAKTDRVLQRELASEHVEIVPFCPEEHGGLGTPRPPSWLESESASAVLAGRERVVTDAGVDVTPQFLTGAEGALSVCRTHAIRRAFLKERSPSCGVCQTHANGKLVDGPGVTTALLQRHGIEVHGVEGLRE